MGNKASCFGRKRRPSRPYLPASDTPQSPLPKQYDSSNDISENVETPDGTLSLESISQNELAVDQDNSSASQLDNDPKVKTSKTDPDVNLVDVKREVAAKRDIQNISESKQYFCGNSSSSSLSLITFVSSDSIVQDRFAPQVLINENMSIKSFGQREDFTDNLEATQEIVERVEETSITKLFDEEYEEYIRKKEEAERLFTEEQELMEKEISKKGQKKEKETSIKMDNAKEKETKTANKEKNQNSIPQNKAVDSNKVSTNHKENNGRKIDNDHKENTTKKLNIVKIQQTDARKNSGGNKESESMAWQSEGDHLLNNKHEVVKQNKKMIGEHELSDEDNDIVQSAASVIQLVATSNDHVRKHSQTFPPLPPLLEKGKFDTPVVQSTNIFPVTFETIKEDKIANFAESTVVHHDTFSKHFENPIAKSGSTLFLLPQQPMTQSERTSLSSSPSISPFQSHQSFESFGNNINSKAAIPKGLNAHGAVQGHFRNVLANESPPGGSNRGKISPGFGCVSPARRSTNIKKISPLVSSESLNGPKDMNRAVSKQGNSWRLGSGSDPYPPIQANSFLSTTPFLSNNPCLNGISSQKTSKATDPKQVSKQEQLKQEILSTEKLTMNKIGEFLESREHIDKTEFDVVVRRLLQQNSSVYPEAKGTISQKGTKASIEPPLYDGRNLAASRFPIVGGNSFYRVPSNTDDRIRKNVRTIYATLPKTTLSDQLQVEGNGRKSPLPLLFSNNAVKDAVTDDHCPPYQRSKVYDRGKVMPSNLMASSSNSVRYESFSTRNSIMKNNSSNSSCVGLPPINRIPLVSVGLPACSMTSIRLRNMPNVETTSQHATPCIKKKKEVRFDLSKHEAQERNAQSCKHGVEKSQCRFCTRPPSRGGRMLTEWLKLRREGKST